MSWIKSKVNLLCFKHTYMILHCNSIKQAIWSITDIVSELCFQESWQHFFLLSILVSLTLSHTSANEMSRFKWPWKVFTYEKRMNPCKILVSKVWTHKLYYNITCNFIYNFLLSKIISGEVLNGVNEASVNGHDDLGVAKPFPFNQSLINGQWLQFTSQFDIR